MFFNVRELEVKKVRFKADFPPGEIEFLDQKIRQLSPLHAEGVAELMSETLGEIRIQGRFSVNMEAECDRCLEPTQFALANEFDLFYLPTPTGHRAEAEAEIPEDESDVGFYEGNGIALGEILREQVLLNMPMQKICRESCKGICPTCGQNRNFGSCTCEVKLVDDRWAALKKLRTGD